MLKKITLDNFLNCKLKLGLGGKELIHQNRQLKLVKDAVEYFSNKDNLNKILEKVKSSNSDLNNDYFYSMYFEFKKDIIPSDSNEIKELLKYDYYKNKENMNDNEIEYFLKNNPVEFEETYISHGFHRACCMIGRLIREKSYIPFYIYKIKYFYQIMNPGINRWKKISTPADKFCFTEDTILAIMDIKQNNKTNIIISSDWRSKIKEGRYKKSNINIIDENNEKFLR